MRNFDSRPNSQSFCGIELNPPFPNGNEVIEDSEAAIIQVGVLGRLMGQYSNEGSPLTTGCSQRRTMFTSTVSSQNNAGRLYSELARDIEFTATQ